MAGSLYAQCHDGVDDIVVVLFEGLDSLLSGDVCLGHDKLDILGLEASVVNLLAIVLVLLFLLLGLGSLALSEVYGFLTSSFTSSGVGTLASGKLLSSGSLSLGVEVLDLSLTEYAKSRI